MTTQPTCGTRAGYLAHTRHREPTCAPCRAAHAAYRRARREAGVEQKNKSCIECGGDTYGLRCKPCAMQYDNPQPRRIERPETREIAYTGTWERRGLVWFPVTEGAA